LIQFKPFIHHEKKENLLQATCSKISGFGELSAKFEQKDAVAGK
jgi:hypothetical protein